MFSNKKAKNIKRDRPPFLIGKGNYPLIWINSIPSKPELPSIPLVKENISLHKELKVKEKKPFSIEVIYKKIIILRVTKLNEEKAEVESLDLTPIGIKIRGDKNGLDIGNNLYKNNSFEVDAMIGIELN